ncbi:uncharacterized protein LOC126734265 [Anthonomus grandis grandis]|uniref:uncharacterized protein LOC126734265 n=1 Tax=Anthonomus grandis grandis TaxID=2921223 RepID=UPI0021651083|nr:uncharacterized protein LOC126734265 [Anthonomus grandis grandis]
MYILRGSFRTKVCFCIALLTLYGLFCVEGVEFSIKKRVRRKVLFTKSSKFFFRLNGKDNVLNYTTLIAHGWGFRINYELPSSLNQRTRFFKRDVHSEVENIQDPFISKIVNCVLKQVCGVLSQPFAQNCGIFCGIGRIIASSQGIEADFFRTFGKKCQLYQERCPASFEKASIFGFGYYFFICIPVCSFSFIKMKLLCVIFLFFIFIIENHSLTYKDHPVLDTSKHLLSRQKRWLVWKPGTNWVSVIFGIGIPVNVQAQSITLGCVMKAFYQLPNNSTYFTHPEYYSTLTRKTRSATRWKIYEMIENYLNRNNYPDGKACLLKSICEISAVPLEQKSGLIAEIFHSIFTPSSTDDKIENHVHNEYHAAEKLGKEVENCDHIFPECPIDPVQQFSKFMTVNKFMR